jgi:hypothetical protein
MTSREATCLFGRVEQDTGRELSYPVLATLCGFRLHFMWLPTATVLRPDAAGVLEGRVRIELTPARAAYGAPYGVDPKPVDTSHTQRPNP